MSDELKSMRRRYLEVAALALGALTLVTSLYFSARAERSKALSVQVLSKRPLVVSGSANSVGLEIGVRGRRVAAPWLVTVRVSNSGSLPIEARDIEEPVRLSIGALILSVDIVRTTPTDLAVSPRVDSLGVVLEHRLLNPGDVIDLDVVTDGEPGAIAVSARISGVPRVLLQDAPSQIGERPPFVLAWQAPSAVAYLVLSLVSLLAVAGLLFGGVGLGSLAILPFRKWYVETDKLRIVGDELLVSFMGRSEPWASDIPMVHAAELDDPGQLLTRVRARLSAGPDPKESEIIARRTMDDIVRVGKELLPAALVRHLWGRLPDGLDRVMGAHVRRTPVGTGSARDYLMRCEAELRRIVSERRGLKAIGSDDLLGFSTLTVLGGILALVIIGSWRNALGV